MSIHMSIYMSTHMSTHLSIHIPTEEIYTHVCRKCHVDVYDKAYDAIGIPWLEHAARRSGTTGLRGYGLAAAGQGLRASRSRSGATG